MKITAENYEKLDKDSKARVTYNFLFEIFKNQIEEYEDYFNGFSDERPNNYEGLKFLTKKVFVKLKAFK